MKFLKVCAFFLLTFTIVADLWAADHFFEQDGDRFDKELNERDFEALKRYLNTKREVPLEEKITELTISGDVRFEWRHLNEKLRGIRLRGRPARFPEKNLPISRNDFDCEFNVKFDFIMDRSWAVAHVQYDNAAGVNSQSRGCVQDPEGWFGSGQCDEVCVRKSYMGYNFWKNDCSRFDIELGRRGNLYHVFDSRVQFLSRFDGILLKWTGTKYDVAKEVFVKLGGFVVDERVNHFAYITEIGFLDIYGSHFDLKYSFIDWCGHVGNRCIKRVDPNCRFRFLSLNRGRAFNFAVSQWTIYYHLDPCFLSLNKPVKFFAAFLMNHKWKHFKVRKNRLVVDPVTGHLIQKRRSRKFRSNLAWYAGIAIGEVVKEGDWAIELQYQWVEALAVPGQDCSGICNDNVLDFTLTMLDRENIDNTNFKGWRLDALYALTDNISINTILEGSTPVNKHIGGPHTYSKVEVEAIYAF